MQPLPYGPPPPQRTAPSTAVVVLSIAAALTGTWIAVATFGLQAAGWLVTELTIELGGELSGLPWLAVAVASAALVGLPAGLVWGLGRAVAPAAAGAIAAARAWTLAGIAGGLLGTLRLIPLPHNEWLLLAQAVLATVLGVLVRLIRRRVPKPEGPRPHVAGLGLAAGLVVLVVWLWAGALGGLTETVFAVLAAAALGWLAAGIVDAGFFAAFARSWPWRVLVGGLSAGVALAPLAAGVGGSGVSLALVVTVSALGFAAAALAGSVQPWSGGLAVSLLVGAAAVGPLAFVDPEETSLILGMNDVARWAVVAAALGTLIALVVGGLLWAALSPRRWLSPWLPATVALVMVVAAAGVYALAGRPGLYGDRLFVVLAEQADLSGLDQIEDRSQRLRTTYERLVSHAERTQAPLRAELDRWGLDYTPFYLVNGLLVDAGPAVREWLSTREDVDRVLVDQRLRPLPVQEPTVYGPGSDPGSEPQWNISMIGADRAWDELDATGAGIVIGSSDSGVDGTHPDLRDGFRAGEDSWYDPWNHSSQPVDHNGHGTHTTGSALGRGGIGVAPAAQWVGCVNLDRNLGSPSYYLECLQFMLAPFPAGGDAMRDGRPDRAPHVLTNSWGCPTIEGCDLGSLRPAVDAIRAAGIFMAVAAGNSGPSCGSVSDPPAPYDAAFTVGAVDRTGMVTNFSSRGPTPDGLGKPDVVAPGAAILSAVPGGGYAEFDGTSMATPHVAGVVALMWSASPALIGDIEATEEILRSTATPAVPSYASRNPEDACDGDDNIIGAGIVDAFAAVEAARAG